MNTVIHEVSSCNEILNKLYHEPIEELKEKGVYRAQFQCDFRYVKELENLNAVSRIKNASGNGRFALTLEPKGFDILEKHSSYDLYKSDSDKQLRFDNLIKLWSIILSAFAIIISGISLYLSINK